MNRRVVRLFLGAVVVVFASACAETTIFEVPAERPVALAEGQIAADDTAGEMADDTALPAPTSTPTPVPTPEPAGPTDNQKILAAFATYDSSMPDLQAYDLRGGTVDGERVEIEVCGWPGDTIYDEIIRVQYDVVELGDGTVDITYVSDYALTGPCITSEIANAALAAANAYDQAWTAILEDPASFSQSDADPVLAPELVDLAAPLVNQWRSENVTWQGGSLDGGLPGSSITEVLWRRHGLADGQLLELAVCRPLGENYGVYQNGTLVDDFRDEESNGEHEIVQYILRERDGLWQVLGTETRVWADCFSYVGGFLGGITGLFPLPTDWSVLPELTPAN